MPLLRKEMQYLTGGPFNLGRRRAQVSDVRGRGQGINTSIDGVSSGAFLANL